MDSTVAFTTTVASEDSKIAATTIVTPNSNEENKITTRFLSEKVGCFQK